MGKKRTISMDESQKKELEQRSSSTDKYSVDEEWGEGFAELEALREKEQRQKDGGKEKSPKKDADTESNTIRKTRVRSKRFLSLKKQVDRQKHYSLEEAIQTTLKLAQEKFDPAIELHLQTKKGGLSGDVALPHPVGKPKTVEIFSSKTIKKIADKKIDFDVLLAKPADMGQIAKYAKFLGPKGLMPNPKAGTITANPKKKAKELTTGGKLQYKTEKKAPLLHLTIGKRSFGAQKIQENCIAIITAINPKQINKAALSSSMGPGIKLNLEQIEAQTN